MTTCAVRLKNSRAASAAKYIGSYLAENWAWYTFPLALLLTVTVVALLILRGDLTAWWIVVPCVISAGLYMWALRLRLNCPPQPSAKKTS